MCKRGKEAPRLRQPSQLGGRLAAPGAGLGQAKARRYVGCLARGSARCDTGFRQGHSKLHGGLGPPAKSRALAQKAICSYLGVSIHFSYMAEEIPVGPGAKKGARLFLQLEDHLLDGTKALHKRLEDCMLQHFPGLKGKSDLDYLSVVDIKIFCRYGYSSCCTFVQKDRLKQPFCKVPYDEALELFEGFTTPTGWLLHVNGRPALEIELLAFSCASEAKKPRLSGSLLSLGEDWRHLEQGP